MIFKSKLLFAGAAVISALAITSSASAVTVVTPFSSGPFSLNNPLGTLPATKMKVGNIYDYTFTLVDPVGSISSTQVQAQLLAHGGSTPELIQYSLYSGAPGSGTFQSQSSLDFSPTIAFSPTAGDYYLEVNVISANNEVAGGTLTAAVPEPASWAMMLVGFGVLGGALRRRATKSGFSAV
jgi:hypothetical protein